MRPLVLSREGEELRIDDTEPARILCESSKVLGNGRIEDLRDIVLVDYHRFDRAQSQEVAQCVSRLNSKLITEAIPYLLARCWPLGIE